MASVSKFNAYQTAQSAVKSQHVIVLTSHVSQYNGLFLLFYFDQSVIVHHEQMNACWLGQSNGWKIILIFEVVNLLMLPAGPELWDLSFNCSQRKRWKIVEQQICLTYLNTKPLCPNTRKSCMSCFHSLFFGKFGSKTNNKKNKPRMCVCVYHTLLPCMHI